MAPELSRMMSRQISMRAPAPLLGAVRVKPMSKTLVVPAIPTEEHWLPLSNLDRVVNPTFSSVILFYKNILGEDTSFQDVTMSLKESLSKVLVHFFPLAGRLALRPDGLVDLHCNDQGAIFIKASVEIELSVIGGPQPMPALSGLEVAGLGAGPRFIPDQLTPLPVLVVQVTKFTCGSIAIAANWHHTVADGSSGSHFMKSWAEVATGNELSLVPNHDRLLLKPRAVLDASLVNGYSTRCIREMLTKGPDNAMASEPAVLTSFRIAKAAVQGLKERVTMEDDESRQFTSAESVSAHLWRQMTKARAESNEGDSETRFFMFVDGRKRLNLPPGYFGNVVCSACAVSPEEDILNKPLAYAASLIRKAMRGISAEYFRSLIDWVEIQGNTLSNSEAKSEHVNSLGHDVAATFWTFFPLYEMDFGWGKPELAARNSPARPLIDGIAMMPSADGPGNMVALLNLHADRMARLQKQASFRVIYSSQT